MTDPLPRADLVHLPLGGVLAALLNVVRSGSRYLLTTTFPGRAANPDIPLGRWRPLDLQAPPFSFPAPLRLIVEGCTQGGGNYRDKSLALWEVDDVRNSLLWYTYPMML
jgi:hypothetical protein